MIAIDGTASAAKSYIVSNGLPEIEQDDSEMEHPEDVHRILILLILSHIFMSNNSVSEG